MEHRTSLAFVPEEQGTMTFTSSLDCTQAYGGGAVLVASPEVDLCSDSTALLQVPILLALSPAPCFSSGGPSPGSLDSPSGSLSSAAAGLLAVAPVAEDAWPPSPIASLMGLRSTSTGALLAPRALVCAVHAAASAHRHEKQLASDVATGCAGLTLLW